MSVLPASDSNSVNAAMIFIAFLQPRLQLVFEFCTDRFYEPLTGYGEVL